MATDEARTRRPQPPRTPPITSRQKAELEDAEAEEQAGGVEAVLAAIADAHDALDRAEAAIADIQEG